jgi:hypothetical protein
MEHGDILFAITGESVEEIAKSTAYMGYERCLVGGDIVVMKHNQNPKYRQDRFLHNAAPVKAIQIEPVKILQTFQEYRFAFS